MRVRVLVTVNVWVGGCVLVGSGVLVRVLVGGGVLVAVRVWVAVRVLVGGGVLVDCGGFVGADGLADGTVLAVVGELVAVGIARHTPFVQVEPGRQVFPQRPQFLTSVLKS